MRQQNQSDDKGAPPEQPPKGFYTFSLFDISGAINTTQLKRLFGPISNLLAKLRRGRAK